MYFINLYILEVLQAGDFEGEPFEFIFTRNKLNNDPSNLRLVSQKENSHNCTMRYAPDITDISKYQKYRNKETAHPYLLRFTDNGVRKIIGYYNSYEEAENKYRELYSQRQKRIDASV